MKSNRIPTKASTTIVCKCAVVLSVAETDSTPRNETGESRSIYIILYICIHTINTLHYKCRRIDLEKIHIIAVSLTADCRIFGFYGIVYELHTKL